MTESKTTSQSTGARRIAEDLKQCVGRSMRVVLPMLCSVALLCWLFHKVNFHSMIAVLHHGVDYWFILLMMGINFMSYIFRGFRWGLQLDAVGIHAKRWPLCVSIIGAYSLNLLFTGFGEAWRCIFISRRKKAPLSTVIGTDVGDRISDLAMVIVVLLLTWALAGHAISAFLCKYAIGKDVEKFADNPWLWGAIFAFIFLTWSCLHYFKRFKLVQEIDQCIENIWMGFMSLFTLKHKWRYLWLTVAIWICYFLQTYVCFYAFPFTRELVTPAMHYGLMPGLVALLFGSMSMAIPSSGGLGPWNLAIMFALSLYGISDTQGAAFAMLAWSAEALVQVLGGIYTMIYVIKTEPSHNAQPA